ncbi:probable carboxylesterase 7 [Gastrolobium bilobum]|uniref:probable carboxylesterase 7 n=1 Tax=Gastrolobium bilobum TaxID=150636 RepID=UPI002AB1289F|nr:probable carboxylesterase 7 [Gastrolobium bilobum]
MRVFSEGKQSLPEPNQECLATGAGCNNPSFTEHNSHLLLQQTQTLAKMAAKDNDITHEFRFFRVYKDGTVELFRPTTEKIQPFDDPATGVRSKDTIISTHPPVSVRIFLPQITHPTRKLPLLLYVHGGGFCMQSAFSPTYHNHVATIVAEANVIAVSVEYGLFPTRPLPAPYEDSWAALQWVASHAGGNGPETWLNNHADLNRVIIAGDSAGGNITHTLVSRVGKSGLPDVKVVGAILVHPFFAGSEDDEMWLYMFPENEGLDDPRLKPVAEDLGRLGCERVLVFAAEKDHLFHAGRNYVEELKNSGWCGNAELVVNWGLEHCFHLFNPKQEKARELLQKFVSFIQHD